MNENSFAKFDDRLIKQFETDWMKGEPRSFDHYLPDPTHSNYTGTLEELVHIDLEFRWKAFGQAKDEAEKPISVEVYLKRFPSLAPMKLGLIQAEFELANRFGDHPTIQSYVEKYGPNIDGSELRIVLKSLHSEIQSSKTLKPGTTIGRYEIVNGRGGFSEVWRATDTKLGRRIAVKRLGQRLATNAESRRRFISEARVTAKLEHPGIVPVYDISGRDEDYAYYTMRLIQGRTLAQAIEDLHQLDNRTPEFELHRQNFCSHLSMPARRLTMHTTGV